MAKLRRVDPGSAEEDVKEAVLGGEETESLFPCPHCGKRMDSGRALIAHINGAHKGKLKPKEVDPGASLGAGTAEVVDEETPEEEEKPDTGITAGIPVGDMVDDGIYVIQVALPGLMVKELTKICGQLAYMDVGEAIREAVRWYDFPAKAKPE